MRPAALRIFSARAFLVRENGHQTPLVFGLLVHIDLAPILRPNKHCNDPLRGDCNEAVGEHRRQWQIARREFERSGEC